MIVLLKMKHDLWQPSFDQTLLTNLLPQVIRVTYCYYNVFVLQLPLLTELTTFGNAKKLHHRSLRRRLPKIC